MRIITFLKNILILLVLKCKQKNKMIIDNRDLDLYKEMTNPAICKLAGLSNYPIVHLTYFLIFKNVMDKSATTWIYLIYMIILLPHNAATSHNRIYYFSFTPKASRAISICAFSFVCSANNPIITG